MTKTKSKKCISCNKDFSIWKTSRKMFCSNTCKAKYHYHNGKTYTSQKNRGVNRKLELINILGGKCDICGYNKNIASLCFHHIIPDNKSIALDLRRIGNSKMEVLLEEVQKCQLLCHNCHNELHHPEYDIEKLNNI